MSDKYPFYTLEEIIEILGRDTVIQTISRGVDGCIKPIALAKSAQRFVGNDYYEKYNKEIAAYISLRKLIERDNFNNNV